MTELHVSQDFINENKQLGQTRPKKGGRYTTHEKIKRRDEVFRLHFEYSYSNRKIAELMKINRHTIDSDIQYLYSRLQREDNKLSLEDQINKQLIRLESQRNRLMQILDKTNSIQEKFQLEKLILEIDSKIANTILRIYDSKLKNWDNSITYINKWMKDNDKNNRFILYGDLLTTSENKKNRIFEILKGKK